MSFSSDYELIDLALKIIDDTHRQQMSMIRDALSRIKTEYERHVTRVQDDAEEVTWPKP